MKFIKLRLAKVRASKGFTVIELMVAVLILVVISSIVLASVQKSRDIAADTAVRKNLLNMRDSAQLYYESNEGYEDVCNPTTDTGKLYANAYAQGSKGLNQSRCISPTGALGSSCLFDLTTVACWTSVGTPVPSYKWAVTVPLKATPGTWFCVDYSGAAVENTAIKLDNHEPVADCM